MTNPRIIWQMPDGTLRITSPVRPRAEGQTEDEWLDAIAADTQRKDPELQVATRLPNVEFADLPEREFRNAWRHRGGVVEDEEEVRKIKDGRK